MFTESAWLWGLKPGASSVLGAFSVAEVDAVACIEGPSEPSREIIKKHKNEIKIKSKYLNIFKVNQNKIKI